MIGNASTLSRDVDARSQDKLAEFAAELRRQIADKLEPTLQVVRLVHYLSDIRPILLGRAEVSGFVQVSVQSSNVGADVTSVADQRGEIGTETSRERMNSALDELCVLQQWVIKVSHGVVNRLHPRPHARLEASASESLLCTSDSDGKPTDFMQQETSNYSRRFIFEALSIPVLIRGDSRRLSRRPPCQSRHHQCEQTHGSGGKHSPPGPERRALFLHRKAFSKSQSHPVVLPVVLEPILP